MFFVAEYFEVSALRANLENFGHRFHGLHRFLFHKCGSIYEMIFIYPDNPWPRPGLHPQRVFQESRARAGLLILSKNGNSYTLNLYRLRKGETYEIFRKDI